MEDISCNPENVFGLTDELGPPRLRKKRCSAHSRSASSSPVISDACRLSQTLKTKAIELHGRYLKWRRGPEWEGAPRDTLTFLQVEDDATCARSPLFCVMARAVARVGEQLGWPYAADGSRLNFYGDFAVLSVTARLFAIVKPKRLVYEELCLHRCSLARGAVLSWLYSGDNPPPAIALTPSKAVLASFPPPTSHKSPANEGIDPASVTRIASGWNSHVKTPPSPSGLVNGHTGFQNRQPRQRSKWVKHRGAQDPESYDVNVSEETYQSEAVSDISDEEWGWSRRIWTPPYGPKPADTQSTCEDCDSGTKEGCELRELRWEVLEGDLLVFLEAYNRELRVALHVCGYLASSRATWRLQLRRRFHLWRVGVSRNQQANRIAARIALFLSFKRCFRQWRELISLRRHQMQIAVMAAATREGMCLREAFFRWTDFLRAREVYMAALLPWRRWTKSARRRLRERLELRFRLWHRVAVRVRGERLLRIRLGRLRLRRCFRGWWFEALGGRGGLSLRQKVDRVSAGRVAAMLGKRTLWRAYARWKEFTREKRVSLRIRSLAVHRMRRHTLFRAFHTWRRGHIVATCYAVAVARFQRRVCRTLSRVAFGAWILFAKRRRVTRHRIACYRRRLDRRLLSQATQVWKRFAVSTRQRKIRAAHVCLRVAFLKKTNSFRYWRWHTQLRKQLVSQFVSRHALHYEARAFRAWLGQTQTRLSQKARKPSGAARWPWPSFRSLSDASLRKTPTKPPDVPRSPASKRDVPRSPASKRAVSPSSSLANWFGTERKGQGEAWTITAGNGESGGVLSAAQGEARGHHQSAPSSRPDKQKTASARAAVAPHHSAVVGPGSLERGGAPLPAGQRENMMPPPPAWEGEYRREDPDLYPPSLVESVDRDGVVTRLNFNLSGDASDDTLGAGVGGGDFLVKGASASGASTPTTATPVSTPQQTSAGMPMPSDAGRLGAEQAGSKAVGGKPASDSRRPGRESDARRNPNVDRQHARGSPASPVLPPVEQPRPSTPPRQRASLESNVSVSNMISAMFVDTLPHESSTPSDGRQARERFSGNGIGTGVTSVTPVKVPQPQDKPGRLQRSRRPDGGSAVTKTTPRSPSSRALHRVKSSKSAPSQPGTATAMSTTAAAVHPQPNLAPTGSPSSGNRTEKAKPPTPAKSSSLRGLFGLGKKDRQDRYKVAPKDPKIHSEHTSGSGSRNAVVRSSPSGNKPKPKGLSSSKGSGNRFSASTGRDL